MPVKNKKEYPIVILRFLESWYDRKSDLFYRVQPDDNYLVKFVDNDPTSDFSFEIISYEIDFNRNKTTYELFVKPGSLLSTAGRSIKVEGSEVNGRFNDWQSFLKEYLKHRSPSEPDFILKQYAEEFFTKFEILDVDADSKSYDYNTQLKIELFLEQVNAKLEEVKTEENRTEIEEIQKEVIDLKNTQTKLTKRSFIKQLSDIAAKCRRHSLGLSKYIFELVVEKLSDAVVKQIMSPGS